MPLIFLSETKAFNYSSYNNCILQAKLHAKVDLIWHISPQQCSVPLPLYIKASTEVEMIDGNAERDGEGQRLNWGGERSNLATPWPCLPRQPSLQELQARSDDLLHGAAV